jgi:hypothetical protein
VRGSVTVKSIGTGCVTPVAVVTPKCRGSLGAAHHGEEAIRRSRKLVFSVSYPSDTRSVGRTTI